MNKIFIIGYMFAGKTTYGRQLANKLLMPFIDLDKLVEQHCEKTIQEIFEEQGELYFRQQEHNLLIKLCEDDNPSVISCGGGTPCFYENLEIMKRYGKVIYLRTPLNTIISRAKKGRQNRPVLSGISDYELNNFITKHFNERESYYLQADLIYDSQSITNLQK